MLFMTSGIKKIHDQGNYILLGTGEKRMIESGQCLLRAGEGGGGVMVNATARRAFIQVSSLFTTR